MLATTFELISLAASNSLAVFCFCNMLIAILLVGSAKPSSQFEEERPNDFPTIVHDNKFTKNEVSLSKKANDLIEAEEEKASSVTVSITTVKSEEESRPAEEEDVENNDDDDDELRKRVEEFIEKINREWRAEKLKSYSLGQ